MPQMSIENIRLQHLQFEMNQDFSVKDTPVQIRYNLSIKHLYKQQKLIVYINVKSPIEDEYKNSPFYFEIVIKGEFKIIGEVEDSIINKYAKINCPAIIFPYLREALADITRRAGFPPFHLQPVNFIKLNNNDKNFTQDKPKRIVKKRDKKKISTA